MSVSRTIAASDLEIAWTANVAHELARLEGSGHARADIARKAFPEASSNAAQTRLGRMRGTWRAGELLFVGTQLRACNLASLAVAMGVHPDALTSTRTPAAKAALGITE